MTVWDELRAASWFALDEEKALEAEAVLKDLGVSDDLAEWHVRHSSESYLRNWISNMARGRAMGSWTNDPGSEGVPLLSDGGTDLGCYWIRNTDEERRESMLALAKEWA